MALLAEIFENAGHAIVAGDANHRIALWNRGAEAVYGWRADEALGSSEDILGSELTAAERDAIRVELNAGRPWRGRVVQRRRDGTRIVAEAQSARIAGSDGEAAYLTVSRDVTALVEQEERLELQADLLSAVGESVVATDLGTTIVYWGSGAERMYGWTADQAVGQDIDELLSTEFPGDDLPTIQATLRAGGSWQGDLARHRRDGTAIDVELVVSSRRDEAGTHIGSIGIGRDVTERRRVERELAEKRDRLAAVHELDLAIVRADQPERLAAAAAVIARRVSGADLAGVATLDRVSGDLEISGVDGRSGVIVPGARIPPRPGTIEQLAQGQVLVIDDLTAVDDSPAGPALAAEGWRRAEVVPLRFGDDFVGAFALLRRSLDVPAVPAGDLLNDLATSVAIGLRQAELRESERNARIELEETAARLTVLSEIGTACLGAATPREVADGVLPIVQRETGATWAALLVADDDLRSMEITAVLGPPISVGVGYRLPIEGPAMDALRAGQRLEIAELSGAAGMNPVFDILPSQGVASVAAEPLLAHGDLVGVLALGWRERREVDDRLRAFMSDGAATVALAIRQARLRVEAERRATGLAALHEVALDLQASRATGDLAEATLRGLERVMEFSHAAVHIIDWQTGRLVPMALRDRLGSDDAARAARERFALEAENLSTGRGISRWVAEHGESARVGDTSRDPRYLSVIEGVRAELCVPIRVDDKVVGVIDLESVEPDAFSADDAALLETMAAQFGVAYENVRTLSELEERVEQRTAGLRQANVDLEAFNYSVSHDLRAPLRAMHGFAAALLEDESERLSLEGRAFAGRIVGAASQMEQIVDDLLDYSRVSRAEVRLGPIDLDAIVGLAAGHCRPKIERSSANLHIQPGLGHVAGHRDTLVLVISALLDNALTYVAHGVLPVVTVRSEVLGPAIRLWVEDAGIGIAEDDLERIFLPLQRLHRRDVYPGTGLGLAIVRRAMDRMGGQVGVESSAGGGSRFWIELPSLDG